MNSRKYNFVTTKIINAAVLAGCLIYAVACSSQGGREFPTTSLPISPRTVTDVNLPFHEQWRRSNLLIFNAESDRLHVYGNQLFFVSYEDDGMTRRLEALNANTGVLLWKTEPLAFTVDSLAADEKILYLALDRKILTYDLLTGEVLWEDALLGGRTTYWVYPLDNKVLVYSEEDVSLDGEAEQVVRTYDSQSGLLIATDRTIINQKNSSLLLKTPTYDYWTDGEMLWAINTEAKHEQWKVAIDNRVEYQPLLVDSKLIFASGIFSDVIGIDNISGDQIWKYKDKIVSDLTAISGTVYAIRTDAAIVGIDSATGEEVGYIGVEPRATETSSRSNAYLIAVSEDMLFVYYGDSQELIAFSK